MPAYVVSSADVAREMLKNLDITFSNRSDSYIFRRLLFDGKDILLAPYGEYWRRIRTICVLQLLSAKRVQSYQAVREEEIAIMIENIKESNSSSLDLSQVLGTLINDILCRIAERKKYSQGGGESKFLKLFDEFAELMGVFNMGEYIPWMKWLNRVNGLYATVDRNLLEFDELLDQNISDPPVDPPCLT